jgi:hypothetical protein
MAHARFLLQALAAFAFACALGVRFGVAAAPPPRLSDAEFWQLVDRFSEPGGFFRSDNLVSNEDTYQAVLPELAATVRPGGAYLGVGPDQNFTYIAATNPAIAFITDIRRGNLQLHLMYKAIFELSESRAAFLSRLLSRPPPAGLRATATPAALVAAFAAARPSRDRFVRTRDEIVRHLERTRPLDPRDRDGIEYVLDAFYQAGPALSYSNTPSGRGRFPTFGDLQRATDDQGVARGYLASEALYAKVRALQQRNLIVPVVGDFAGGRALRAIGAYLRDREMVVAAFYTSNVEQYLFEDGTWHRFADNVAALPTTDASLFVRSCFNNYCAAGAESRSSVLLDPIAALLQEVRSGKVSSYSDVLAWRR